MSYVPSSCLENIYLQRDPECQVWIQNSWTPQSSACPLKFSFSAHPSSISHIKDKLAYMPISLWRPVPLGLGASAAMGHSILNTQTPRRGLCMTWRWVWGPRVGNSGSLGTKEWPGKWGMGFGWAHFLGPVTHHLVGERYPRRAR